MVSNNFFSLPTQFHALITEDILIVHQNQEIKASACFAAQSFISQLLKVPVFNENIRLKYCSKFEVKPFC